MTTDDNAVVSLDVRTWYFNGCPCVWKRKSLLSLSASTFSPRDGCVYVRGFNFELNWT